MLFREVGETQDWRQGWSIRKGVCLSVDMMVALTR